MKKQSGTSDESPPLEWRSPTISEISYTAGVGTATVDRVLNNRSGVSERSKLKVREALEYLKSSSSDRDKTALCVGVLVDSGISFNQTFQYNTNQVSRKIAGVRFIEKYAISPEVDPAIFASEILTLAKQVDGLLLVAREHTAINMAVDRVTRSGKPVICLTTDLPNSDRTAYVGEDQSAAGATAAFLLGNSIRNKKGRILFVLSLPFRCQREREQGFRHVLRTKFPELHVDETVSSHEDSSKTYEEIRNYLKENRSPSAIYNVAGGNIGVAKALREADLLSSVTFVGHELNENSTRLLEQGEMDYVIGHRVYSEILESIQLIQDFRNGLPVGDQFSETLIHTKYNSIAK